MALAKVGVQQTFSPQDFLLKWKDASEVPEKPAAPQTQRQSWQEMKMIGMMYAAAFNAEE